MKKTINFNIEEYLDYYIGLTSSPGYAVMISGNWGSGKSTFIKSYFDSRSCIKSLYVSLNGLSSIEAIEMALVRALYPKLDSKFAQRVGKTASALIEAKLGTSFPLRLTDFLKVNIEYVLVFDDLERVKVDVLEVLGLISNYVEQKNHKVVVVAHESEIKDLDNYKTQKEKIIGKSFSLEPDFENAISRFSNEINDDSKKAIISIKENIHQTFLKSNLNNLRILRYSILDFDRIYSILNDEIKSNELVINDLFTLLFIFTVEYTDSKFTKSVIEKLPLSGWYTDSNDEGTIKSVIEKYGSSIFNDILMPAEHWENILIKGVINKDAVNHHIGISHYFSSKVKPLWKQYFDFYYLTDKEFIDITFLIDTAFKNYEVTEYGMFLHIYGTKFQLSDAGILQTSSATLFSEGVAYIQYLGSNGLISTSYRILDEFIEEDAFDGYIYSGSKNEYFKKLVQETKKCIKDQVYRTYPNECKELLKLMTHQNYKKFIAKLLGDGNDNFNFWNKPILQFMNVDDFFQVYLNLPPRAQSEIHTSIKDRYRIGRMNLIDNEFMFLYGLQFKLENEISTGNGLISKMRFKNFLKVISDLLADKISLVIPKIVNPDFFINLSFQ